MWVHFFNSCVSQDARTRDFNSVEVVDLSGYDAEELNKETNHILVFVMPSYTDGTPPESCALFYTTLKELSHDFRVHKTHLQQINYAVFGIGSSVYEQNFNAVAKELDHMLHRLSAQRLVQTGLADNGPGVEITEEYNRWSRLLWKACAVKTLVKPESATVPSKISSTTSAKLSARNNNETVDEADEDSADDNDTEPLLDVEDMGSMAVSLKKKQQKQKAKASKQNNSNNNNDNLSEDDDEGDDHDGDEEEEESSSGTTAPKEMLTPSLRQSLSKQGYKLLGSHSGVKLCRWTKAMLRGRGGCYKHTFYGITSFQCMEMTPSLACANKCVFCWRHHKNPVGKEWKWQVDQPEVLFEAAVKNHQQMIKQLKGVPGVDKERFDTAFTIRHCALSLVGEPIIYPYINQFIDLLHKNNISSFMVTNAQFPDKIVGVVQVNQRPSFILLFMRTLLTFVFRFV